MDLEMGLHQIVWGEVQGQSPIRESGDKVVPQKLISWSYFKGK